MVDNNNSQSTILGELRNLKSVVEEVSVSLRNQRDILKKRGMNLPPMVLTNLGAVTNELASLETRVVNDQTELGQLRSLVDTAAMVNSSLNLDNVLEDAMDVVINLTDAERGYIILKNEATGELEYRIKRDMEIGPNRGETGITISQTIVKDVLDTGEPLLADNAYKDERLQGNLSIANFALRSVLCVPLKYKDDIAGVVYVDNRLRAGVFTEREKNLLMAFANTASVSIANARLYTSIQQTLAEITEVKDLMDSVFESVGSGVITTDANDKIETFNRAASQILARDPDTTKGKYLRIVLPKISADLDEHLEAIRVTGESQVIDAEMELPTRGRIAVSMRLSPLKDGEQRTRGVAMVMDDLTEQKGREHELSVLKRYLPPEMVENIHSIAGLALGGERREVSCLFVEVRSYATLPDDMKPKDIMNRINVYLAIATDCIHKNGGVIDKYNGNEIMVLFNTQLNPMDDHASRAVETGLAIREAFVKLYKQLNIDPDPHYYRIGIHTGIATLGNVGNLTRREFTAIGDTINLSKRLQENTPYGQIILSDECYQHVQAYPGATNDTFRIEERDAIKVKGREQAARIYEVYRT